MVDPLEYILLKQTKTVSTYEVNGNDVVWDHHLKIGGNLCTVVFENDKPCLLTRIGYKNLMRDLITIGEEIPLDHDVVVYNIDYIRELCGHREITPTDSYSAYLVEGNDIEEQVIDITKDHVVVVKEPQNLWFTHDMYKETMNKKHKIKDENNKINIELSFDLMDILNNSN